MHASNNNELIISTFTQKDIKKVSLFCNKSSINNRWKYYAKVQLQNGQTKVTKEVFGNTIDELLLNVKKEMNKLPKE